MGIFNQIVKVGTLGFVDKDRDEEMENMAIMAEMIVNMEQVEKQKKIDKLAMEIEELKKEKLKAEIENLKKETN